MRTHERRYSGFDNLRPHRRIHAAHCPRVIAVSLPYRSTGYASPGPRRADFARWGGAGSADDQRRTVQGRHVPHGTTETIGIVLRDALVVDIVQANATIGEIAIISCPAHAVRHGGVHRRLRKRPKGRVYAIVNDSGASKALEGKTPAYVRKLAEVKTLAPIHVRDRYDDRGEFLTPIAENAAPEARAKADRRAESQTRASRTCF